MDEQDLEQKQAISQWFDEHPVERRHFLKWAGMISASASGLFSGLLLPQVEVAHAAGWQAKTAPLMTQWAAAVSPTNAWTTQYPRPQMKRNDWQNLNGVWQYGVSTGSNETPPFGGASLTQSILVPYPKESALSGIMDTTYQPYLWYRTTFSIPSSWSGRRVVLNFGAVDWQATVYVNQQNVGTHSGGYSAFSFDITNYLNGGNNEVIVHVYDPTELGNNPHQPYGKQIADSGRGAYLYSSASGIWQTVWLEPVSTASITRLDMTPDIDNQVLRLTVQGTGINGQTVAVVASTNGTQVGSATGNVGSEIDIPIPNPHLWSPDDPFLYTLQVSLVDGSGHSVDQVSSYFGMRIIGIATINGVVRPVLNHTFTFLTGTLDQGYWPDGIYTPPTEDALKFDIQQTKALGFNMIRKHMKVESDLWYYWADQIGLVVWQDMPATFASAQHPVINSVDVANYWNEFEAIVNQRKSTTCIVAWSPYNEGWGEPDGATVQQTVNKVRGWDPTRLIDEATGGIDYSGGDVYDIHYYPAPQIVTPTNGVGRILFNGEYGGIMSLVAGHVWEPGEQMPTLTSADLSNRFVNLLNYNQELMLAPGTSGTGFTQITDVEGELNGLLTYDRAVLKLDANQVLAANQQIIAASRASTSAAVLWLKADAGVTANGSGQVSGWQDQSGQKHNATPGTGQPTLVNNALNGHPVIRFDGNASQLVLPRVIQDDFTIIVVFRSSQGVGPGNAWYTSAGIVDAEIPGIVNDFGMGLSAQGQVNAGAGNPDTFVSSGGGFNDGHAHVVVFKRTRSSGVLTLYVDGNQVATATGGTQSLTSPTRITLGSTQTNANYLNGDIAEVFIYNVAVPDVQRHTIENYLYTRYINPAGPATNGLVAWLRADAGVTANGSGQVSNWADQSGQSNNATVGTGQPTLVNNALNGHPVIHFDGNTSQLALPRAIQDDFTVIAAFRSTQGVGTGNTWYGSAGIVDAEVSGVQNDFGMALNAQGQINVGTGNPDTSLSSLGGYNDGNVHVVVFKRVESLGKLTLYIDGQEKNVLMSAGTQSLTTPNRITLGSTQTNANYLNGDIAEVMLYTTALADSDRYIAQSYLWNKYAGVATIPTNGLVSWLKADTEVTANGSGQVSSWADQSGQNNNATSGSGQPTLVNNALNGHPVIHFDGVASQLVLPRVVQDDFTIVVVFRSSQGVGTGNAWYTSAGIVDAEVTGFANDFGMGLSSQGQVNAGTGNPDTFANSGGGFNDGHAHIATFKRVRSSGSLTLYMDRQQAVSVTAGTQSLTSPTRITLGSTQTNVNYLNGDIAEVIIYNSALSDADRQSVESYLHSKYATA